MDKIEICSSLESGEPFPRDLTEDLIENLNASGIEIIAYEYPDEHTIKLTCKIEFLSLIEPRDKVKKKVFTFNPNNTTNINIPEPPKSETETFWFVSSSGDDIPSTILQKSLEQKVYSASGVKISKCKQAESSCKDRWEYSCASTDMPDMIEHASKIKLSGFSFKLLQPSHSTEPPLTSTLPEKYIAESIYFTELIEKHSQSNSNYAEIQLKAFCFHLSYELRKLESDYTDLRGDCLPCLPSSINDVNYSRSLMCSEDEKQCFTRMEKCMLSEGLQSELDELKSIEELWERSVQQIKTLHLNAMKKEALTQINNTLDRRFLALITPIKDSVDLSDVFKEIRQLKCYSLERENRSDLVKYILSTYAEARRDLTESYKALEKRCTTLLNRLRPVDLPKLLDLARTHPNKVSEFTGKRVIALLGNTGVGKSTTIQYLHGGRFEVERTYRDHYIVSYTDHQLQCAGPNLLKIASGSSSSSTTFEVNATQMNLNEKEWLVLDTPGFGDTNGTEFEIINGLNISAALKASACVKLVVVLSDYCLGNKLLRGTDVKDCCRTVLNMFETHDTSKSVKSLSYLFTKMDRRQASSICALFRDATPLLADNEKDIETIWADIADKTVSGAMMVCPLTDTEEERNVVRNYFFNTDNDLVIEEPATIIGNCLGRGCRDLLKAQLKKVRESIANALKIKNVDLLRFRLEQLQKISLNPTLEALTECVSEYGECVQFFLKEVEEKFVIIEQLAELTCPLSDHQIVDLTEAFEIVCVFDESRGQLLHEGNGGSCVNLQVECRLVLQRYIDSTSKLLQSFLERRVKWKDMQNVKEFISQLLVLKKSLEHSSRAESRAACADVIKVLNLFLSSNGALNTVDNLKDQLQRKFDSERKEGNLVDCLKYLNDAQNYENTFNSLIAEIIPDIGIAPFYNRMKEDFLTECNFLLNGTIDALKTNDTAEFESLTNCVQKLGTVDQFGVNRIRVAVVAFKQLFEYLSTPSLNGSRKSSEFLMHFDDFNVQQSYEKIAEVALHYFQYHQQLFSTITPSQFSLKDNRERIQIHYQNIETLLDFPFPNSAELKIEGEKIFRLISLLCQKLYDTAEMQLSTLITSPKECDGALLVKCVSELHDSAYFHQNLHHQIAKSAMKNIKILFRQQLNRMEKCEIQSLAVANFSCELLRTAALTACGGNASHIENQESVSSVESTVISFWKDTESCIVDLQMRFKAAFFDNGCYVLEEFYSSLQSNFQSLSQYVPATSQYRTKERDINTFLQGCDATQWCFPDSAGNDLEKVPFPNKSLLFEMFQKRKSRLNAQFEQIEKQLHESFRWLLDPYSKKFMYMLKEQSLSIPQSNQATDGVPTSANLVDTLEYLQIYESEANCPIGKIKEQLAKVSTVLNDQLGASNIAMNVLENISKLAQDLERLDRFISADMSFKELANVAKAKILSAKKGIRSALENHDFQALGIAMDTDNTNEVHEIFLESLVKEIDKLLSSIKLSSSLFVTLSKLHSAHEYCGRFLTTQLADKIRTKTKDVTTACTRVLGEASLYAEKGSFRECVDRLLEVQEIFVNCELRETSADCSTAANSSMVTIIGCILCGGSTAVITNSNNRIDEIQCNRCHSIQPAGISSRDFQFVTRAFADMSEQFNGCVNFLKESLSPYHVIRDICSGCESESDDEKEDFNDQYARDDTSTRSNLNKSKNGWRLLYSVCIEMEYLKAKPRIASLLNINVIDDMLRNKISDSVLPLIEKAMKIIEIFKEDEKATLVVDELNDVRSSIIKLKILKKLVGSYFAPYRENLKLYTHKLKAADKYLNDAIHRDDLETLIKFQEMPEIKDNLEAMFRNFAKVVLKGSDIMLALQLIYEEGRHWCKFDRGRTVNMVKSFLVQYEKIRPNAKQLVRHEEAEVQFIRDNFDSLVGFLHSVEVLVDIAKSETDPLLNRTQEFLKGAVSICCTDAREIDSILKSFEAVIPSAPEAAYSASAFIKVSDLYRLQTTWSQVNEYSDIVARLIDSSSHYPKVFAFIESAHIAEINSLFDVNDRIVAIRNRCQELLFQLSFVNAKTDTLNRPDKDVFYSLFYFCYKFVVFYDLKTAANYEHINNEITSNIEKISKLCLGQIGCINSTMDLSSNCFACIDKAIGNLLYMLSIEDIFVEFQTVAKKKIGEINDYFEKKLKDIIKDAELTDSQWNDWVTYIPKVMKQLILLKAISRGIQAFRTFAETAIINLLAKYRQTCASEDIANDFIARLGTALEQSSSNGLGQKIIEDTPIFAGCKNFIRNLQFARISLEDTLTTIDNESEKTRLRQLYRSFNDRYWKLVERGLPKDKRAATKAFIPEKVKVTADNIRLSTSFDVMADNILGLVVLSFAYWTLNNLEGYDTTPSTNTHQKKWYLTQPHPGQIIVVLRLLGLDAEKLQAPSVVHKVTQVGSSFFSFFFTAKDCKISFLNHLAEIRTGEGKSIVLAVTATVLALLGCSVDIACYSEYLTHRDNGAFDFMFKAFDVKEHIQYNTFKNLCESLLLSQGDIRQLMGSTILGNPTSQFQNKKKQVSRTKILLVDEVDVLFGSNFFGKSYNVLTSLKGIDVPEIVELVKLIWTFRTTTQDSVWFDRIIPSPAYQACLNRFKEWPFLIESAAKRMLHDVRDLDHKVDEVSPQKGIGYFDDDNTITFNKRDGYKTLFAYINENEKDKTKISDKQVLEEMNILVNAGTFSYAELPKLYSITLGVSGTLHTLSKEEKQMLERDYKIVKWTSMPSAYPSYSTAPVFTGKFGMDIIASNSANFFANIAEEIKKRIIGSRGKKRAVLVFFQNESILEDFSTSDDFREYTASAQKLVKKTLPADRDSAIARAVEEGRVTLLIAAYGRGTDFNYNNKELDESGGIHVIQAFLSEESSEETQLMGRTHRQGHPGSFSMVLNDSDFEAIGMKQRDVGQFYVGQEIFPLIQKFRSTRYAKKCAQRKELAEFMRKEHEESERILDDLWKNDLTGVKNRIAARNQSRIEFVGVVSRTVILLDATGSMGGFFSKCKTTVKEMLKRICEILKEKKVTCGFEVQFVVYRNYPSKKCLLQASQWESDPEALKEFIDKTEVSGGVGGNESIETAFWFVNQQIEKGVNVTQVIIIGDQGPNTLNQIDLLRGSVKSDNLKGDEYWNQRTTFKVKTHYKQELKKIKDRGIPIHARYLNVSGSFPAKESFEEFARESGGTSGELEIDEPHGAEQLTALFAAGILRNIQNRTKDNGVDLYSAYLAKHPHADIGFV